MSIAYDDIINFIQKKVWDNINSLFCVFTENVPGLGGAGQCCGARLEESCGAISGCGNSVCCWLSVNLESEPKATERTEIYLCKCSISGLFRLG